MLNHFKKTAMLQRPEMDPDFYKSLQLIWAEFADFTLFPSIVGA